MMTQQQLVNQRYKLEQKLGSGGMGIVYKAQDRLTTRIVALKRLVVPTEYLAFMSMSSSSNLLYSLAKEFEMLASLRHPHIISVLDYGFDDDQQPFLTMEFLESAELISDYAQRQSFEVQIELLIQMLQALVYLHRRSIIHRDLKPGNVMIVEGQVKVLDFGLSLKRGEAVGQEGTIGYMAPELLEGQAPTEASDLYAVGVIAYELFAGQLPFYHGDVEHYVEAILHNEVDLDLLDTSEAVKLIVAKLLAKQPEERYISAVDVIRSLAAISGQTLEESAAIRESFLQAATFVGRDAELNQLAQALDEAVNNHGSVWLVGGESGVGKSRLIDELRTQALVQGIQVVRGQGVADGGLSYQLWREVVRRLVLATELTDLEASILKEIIPDIGMLLEREVPLSPKLEGKAGQQRLQLTIIDVLIRQTQPILLLLEDLHWAQESLSPLQLLLNHVSELSLLVIGTYRDDEKPDLPQTLDGSQLLKLERLTTESIQTLSASMLGKGGARPEVVGLLQQETEGNVFFLVEVVRALAEAAGGLGDIGQMTLPRSVFAGGIQQVIRRRLAKVPARYRPLLNLAAIAGRQLDLAILEELKGDQNLYEWLTICQNAAVLEVREDQWRFSHDKLREALLQDLDEDTLPDLHQRIAEAIERTYPDNEKYYEILLEHWHQAGDFEREMQYLPQVSRVLVSIQANYQRAQDLLQRALNILPADDQRRSKLLNLLASSYWQSSRYEEAYDIALQAEKFAHQHNDQIGIAKSLDILGRVMMNQGNLSKAQEYIQKSLEVYRTQDVRTGIVSSFSSLGEIAKQQADYSTARSYYQQGLEIVDFNNDHRRVAALFNNLGTVEFSLGNLRRALEYYEKTLEIIQELDSRRDMIIISTNLGNLSRSLKEYDKALEYQKKALKIAESIGDRFLHSMILHNIGEIESSTKNYEGARHYYLQSLSLQKSMGDKVLHPYTLNALGFVELNFDLKLATAYFCEAITMARSINSIDNLLASVVGLASLYQQRGQETYASQLLGFVTHHPSFDSEIQQHIDKIVSLIKENLSSKDYEAALERGKSLNLDETVEKILAEFGEDAESIAVE